MVKDSKIRSVYFSEMLYKNGFPGEKLDNGSAIVVKSHLNSFKYDDTRLYVKLKTHLKSRILFCKSGFLSTILRKPT